MKIIADAFGGDNSPLEIIKGCSMAVSELGVEILLTGDKQIIEKTAAENNVSLSGIEIVDAPDIISMEDQPNELLRSKKNSSLAVALRLLAEGKGDGFVGAGSTGAMLVGATLIVGRIKGIKRPALAPVIPCQNGKFMLIDCGANVDCRPDMLVQFATMGSIYMEKVMGISSPKVGLINIGTESTKGGELQQQTYSMLSESSLNFVGNTEARELPLGACDVAVCDGFTGNVVLKLYEGMAKFLLGQFKGIFGKNARTKVAAAMLLTDVKELKASLDYNEYGGAPFLGVKAPVFKAHGTSTATTFKNAIKQLKIFIETDVTSEIASSLKK